MKKTKIISIPFIGCLVLSMLIQPVIGKAGSSINSMGYRGGQQSSITSESEGENSGSSRGKHGASGKGSSNNSQDSSHGNSGSGSHSDSGSGSGGKLGSGGKDNSKKDVGGTITLIVTVEWPQNTDIPNEIDITLWREGIPTIVTTSADSNWEVTLLSEPSGDCLLTGEAIPGYKIPVKEVTLTGVSKTINETLIYESGTFNIEDVTLNKNELDLITGFEEKLIATVEPLNANNQNLIWTSLDNSIVTVDTHGIVRGVSTGDTTIEVSSNEDNSIKATCVATVATIESIEPITINAIKGQTIVLPQTVVANLDNGEVANLPVTWSLDGSELEHSFKIPMTPTAPLVEDDYTIVLQGVLDNYTGNPLFAKLEINVEVQSIAIPVNGVTLNKTLLSINKGFSEQLTATIFPSNATTSDIIWSSSDESVAIVVDGLVTGISTGEATITAKTVDGGFKAYCLLSVGMVPEISYIFPSLKNGIFGEHFDNLEEIYINIEYLVAKLQTEFDEANKAFPEDGITYYVKVKDNASILGEGKVTIFSDKIVYEDGTEYSSPDTIEFNLYTVTEFQETNSYSSRYFVYMSQYEDYPKDDEKTLMTNFMGGTATPTIPTENVDVTVEMIGGNWDTPEGIIFILCREEVANKLPKDIVWTDYYEGDPIELLDSYNNGSITFDIFRENFLNQFRDHFVDEVKMIGIANADGVVEWIPPRESLKLGGYLLLEVTPPGYENNLHLINPDSDDGELIKAVHLMRDSTIIRHIKNIYVGNDVSK